MIITSVVASISTVLLALCLRGPNADAASCVREQAEKIAERLDLSRPITVAIIAEAPKKNAGADEWAWTRRDRNGAGCQIDLLPDAARDLETIAHEVCHCKYDWDVMTTSGEVRVKTKTEREKIEARAWSCAEEIVR